MLSCRQADAPAAGVMNRHILRKIFIVKQEERFTAAVNSMSTVNQVWEMHGGCHAELMAWWKAADKHT